MNNEELAELERLARWADGAREAVLKLIAALRQARAERDKDRAEVERLKAERDKAWDALLERIKRDLRDGGGA